MTLAEVMVAAVVFLTAAGAALEVGSRSAAAVARAERQQQELVRVTAALERSELRLRRLANQLAAGALPSCEQARLQMAAALEPAAADLGQRLRPEGDGLLLELGHGLPRRRLLHPVAYGLCAVEP
jgi:hypothetical protein